MLQKWSHCRGTKMLCDNLFKLFCHFVCNAHIIFAIIDATKTMRPLDEFICLYRMNGMVFEETQKKKKYQIVSDILRFCIIISSVCCVVWFTIQHKLCTNILHSFICGSTWDKTRSILFLLFFAYSVGRTIPTRNRWVAFIVFVLVCYALCIPRICYWLLCFVFYSIRRGFFLPVPFSVCFFFLHPFVALSIFFRSENTK